MNSPAAVEQWRQNCAARTVAYRAGLAAGAASAAEGRDTYDPAGDPRYAASYRTGWTHGWLRTTRRQRARLEYLRAEIRAERISWADIAELQSLTAYIEPGDTELLEWAGVPETTTTTTGEPR